MNEWDELWQKFYVACCHDFRFIFFYSVTFYFRFSSVDVALKTNWNKYLYFLSFCLYIFSIKWAHWVVVVVEEKLLFGIEIFIFLVKDEIRRERHTKVRGGWREWDEKWKVFLICFHLAWKNRTLLSACMKNMKWWNKI